MPIKSLFFPNLVRQAHYPTYRQYRDYRDYVRSDSGYRCVYCDIHENELNRDSRTRNDKMTLDHFRPKSLFPHLEINPHNLVLACQDCNHNKHDDFPAYGRPDGSSVDGVAGYIDPFETNRNDYFSVNHDGELTAKQHPADYMIRVLLLNGIYKKKIRRRRIQLAENCALLEGFFDSEINALTDFISKSSEEEQKALTERMISLQTMKALLLSIQQLVELY